MYYADRMGLGLEPVPDVQAFDTMLKERTPEPKAFLMFFDKEDSGYLGIDVPSQQKANDLRARLMRDFSPEAVNYKGRRFEIYHIPAR